MRSGVNPQKYLDKRNVRFWHRILVPIHIPDLENDYYKESLDITKICLERLIATINPETTAITVINNNSIVQLRDLLSELMPSVDKVVHYNSNKGKVNAVLAEVRGAYEPFITITDADVLFFAGWETAVFEVFQTHPKAGVVSPLPMPALAFYHNESLFFDHLISSRLKYGSVTSQKDHQLYLKSMSNDALLKRVGSQPNWNEKQYYLDRKTKAIVGAGHFAATYRTKLFRGEESFPERVFENAYESVFIDQLASIKGYYRLSTKETFAYHMGNKLDKDIPESDLPLTEKIDKDLFTLIQEPRIVKIPFAIKKAIFKLVKRIRNR
ncbi:glycosyltransferase [Croceiramulus getboli]|nr:glycosyltransferase [Flavobacteriaceae bacterium YJPT1-3]